MGARQNRETRDEAARVRAGGARGDLMLSKKSEGEVAGGG